MTTIAYRDGVMAADTGSNYNGTVAYSATKMLKHNGWLVGVSGTARVCVEFMNWFKSKSPDSAEDVQVHRFNSVLNDEDGVWALLVDKQGRVFKLDQVGPLIPAFGKFHAIGAGQDLALGAMAAGATAKEAVKIAAKYDVHTNGKIEVKHHESI